MSARKLSKRTVHTFHYMILFLLMATAFFAYINSSGRSEAQREIGVVVALTYFLWGIFHHLYDRDLNWKIVVEYLALGIFGLAAFWALVF